MRTVTYTITVRAINDVGSSMATTTAYTATDTSGNYHMIYYLLIYTSCNHHPTAPSADPTSVTPLNCGRQVDITIQNGVK